MAKKIAKHSTEKNFSTKLAAMYPDLFFFRQEPIQYAYIERLMLEWRQWVLLPKSLRIEQFWNEKGISTKYLYLWMKKYPEVQETYEYILRVLTDRRDIGALIRELDGNQVRYTFWKYEQGEREFLEWKANLARKEEGSGGGNITVVLEQFPESKLVPQKKVEE